MLTNSVGKALLGVCRALLLGTGKPMMRKAQLLVDVRAGAGKGWLPLQA